MPEAMSDVFGEIGELKRALEHSKFLIKKCNDETKARELAAAVAAATAAQEEANQVDEQTENHDGEVGDPTVVDTNNNNNNNGEA